MRLGRNGGGGGEEKPVFDFCVGALFRQTIYVRKVRLIGSPSPADLNEIPMPVIYSLCCRFRPRDAELPPDGTVCVYT